jgi:hypothetical protein
MNKKQLDKLGATLMSDLESLVWSCPSSKSENHEFRITFLVSATKCYESLCRSNRALKRSPKQKTKGDSPT